jgi:hypothetical protein
MGKRILITSGTVYGPLDDNKLVGNRVRGIWATKFARWLVERGHVVTLLVADIQAASVSEQLASVRGDLAIIKHSGFWDYQNLCRAFASSHDAAVMAAAVVNWIPAYVIDGKMSTTSLRELGLGQPVPGDGYTSGDTPIPGKTIVNVPFILAPRVIDRMRIENPKLTLIGCKMTIGASHSALLDAAYKTLVDAKCHAVIANDMNELRLKTVTYPDRASFDFDIRVGEGDSFYQHLEAIITDEHFHTASCSPGWTTEQAEYEKAMKLFGRIARKYRARFVQKSPGHGRVFGSIAVRLDGGALCSPREKFAEFDGEDSVDVAPLTKDDIANREVNVVGRDAKATMNAPLLLRHLDAYPKAAAVLHLHEQLPDVPTVPYAPPGTVRDNLREIVAPIYNIDGHGFIAALDDKGEFLK